jgi:hypothetical protein
MMLMSISVAISAAIVAVTALVIAIGASPGTVATIAVGITIPVGPGVIAVTMISGGINCVVAVAGPFVSFGECPRAQCHRKRCSHQYPFTGFHIILQSTSLDSMRWEKPVHVMIRKYRSVK